MHTGGWRLEPGDGREREREGKKKKRKIIGDGERTSHI